MSLSGEVTMQTPSIPLGRTMLLVLAASGLVSASISAADELQVGIGLRVITPDPLLPISGGMGPTQPAREKRGELTARAIVLRMGSRAIAIVQLDVLGFPSVLGDRVRARVPRLPPANILIGATHTHSAPCCYALPDGSGGHTGHLQYIDAVCVKAAEAINEALDRMQPAQLRVATGEAQGRIAYNYYAPELYDRRMSVLQAVGANGLTLATLVNYAVHPEVLGPDSGILSPDLVGPLCERIESLGGGMAMFMNGAQGGMITADNRDVDRPPAADAARWRSKRTWDECVRIGHTMADEAMRIVRPAPLQASPSLFCVSTDVTLPVESDALWNVVVHSPLGYPRGRDRTVTTRINVVNLGNAQILTIPGEALPNIGYYLKRKMRGEHNLIFGLTNDAFGYILTKVDFQSFPRYDYVSRVSLGESTGEILIDRSLRLVERCPEPDRLQTGGVRARGGAARITIDGRLDDWSRVPIYQDPAGDPHDVVHKGRDDQPAVVDHPDVDLLEFRVTHDDENLYLLWRAAGQVGRSQTGSQGPPSKAAGRYYAIVAIDADQLEETGYWLHEGGYHPSSGGYDLNAEVEFFDGTLNTVCYLNHGVRDAAELQQALLDQSAGAHRSGLDGPYPAGFVRLSPGTYKQYTEWVYHADNRITFVRDAGPIVSGVAQAAVSEDGHSLEAAFPLKGFLINKQGQPVLARGSRINLSFSLEASGQLAPGGQWASDTAEPIRGYVLD
jgi:hypothetical protein